MKKKKSLEKALKHEYSRLSAEIKATAEMDKRVLDDALTAFAQAKEKKTASRHFIPWKRHRQSRITKLVAAAALILAALLILDPLGGTEIAWGEVAERVDQLQTFLFQMNMSVADNKVAKPDTQIQWTVYLSSEYGFRMDTHMDGEVAMQVFVPPAQDHMIWVVPKEKKAMRMPVTEDQIKQVQRDDRDPKKIIREFMAQGYQHLGRKILNGREVEGIEVLNPPSSGDPWENSVGRLWVNVETELPVRLEIEGAAGGKVVQWVMDFSWEEEFAASVFKPDFPVDFSPVVMLFPKLFDPEYGIPREGLTQEQACEMIVTQFWQALIDENLLQVRVLLPGVDDMGDEDIRKVLDMDSDEAAVELLSIGEISLETTNLLGPVVRVPCTYKCRDGKIRQISLLIQFRQYGVKASCVIYGDAGDKRVLE